MSNSTQIVLAEDGAHIIPLAAVRHLRTGEGGGTGELKWHPSSGATFHVTFPGRRSFRFAFEKLSDTSGAGTVSAFSREPEWVAAIPDGSECRLYSTIHQVQTTASFPGNWETHVSGRAGAAQLTIGFSSPIAFFHDTPANPRLLFAGLDIQRWPNEEDVSYIDGDNHITRGRGWLNLRTDKGLQVFAASPGFKDPKTAWLVCDPRGPIDVWDFGQSHYNTFGFLSFLAGRHTPVFWQDDFAVQGVLSRTYFGTKKWDQSGLLGRNPLPINGVEAFRHLQAVLSQIEPMYSAYLSLAEYFDVGWIIGPLWYAEESFIDDKLALASVAIERVASSFAHFQKRAGTVPETAPFWSNGQSHRVRKALKETLADVAKEVELGEDQIRVCQNRIDQLGQMPNADKILAVFEYLAISVTEAEIAAVANRNVCLHGRRTLDTAASIEAINEEMVRYDTLTMLVYKALLRLMKYRGPYVDYSQRTSGNFPIEMM